MRAVTQEPDSVTSALHAHIRARIAAAGGWIGFDRYMALALYTPGLGYYANDSAKFGPMPEAGSDFVTAPELSPLFGQTLALQLAQALQESDTQELWEFGAGSGALALQLLDALAALGQRPRRYTIVELSGRLRARQQALLAPHAHTLRWADRLPAAFSGVVIGNELLDAMPVQLLARHGGEQDGVWHERGVVCAADGSLAWCDRPSALRPPVAIPGPQDYLTEIHPQAQAFIRTLAARLRRGAIFLIDYGFGESEYYHPQRHMGTVMCHQRHRAGGDPLHAPGSQDISAHVNFSAIALSAQQAGLQVLGYTTQAHFLMNCGLVEKMQQATQPQRATAAKLLLEHEMGELFKVLALGAGPPWEPLGFVRGDRGHRL